MPKTKRYFPKREIEDIVAQYQNGFSCQKIARKHYTTVRTISGLLKAESIAVVRSRPMASCQKCGNAIHRWGYCLHHFRLYQAELKQKQAEKARRKEVRKLVQRFERRLEWVAAKYPGMVGIEAYLHRYDMSLYWQHEEVRLPPQKRLLGSCVASLAFQIVPKLLEWLPKFRERQNQPIDKQERRAA